MQLSGRLQALRLRLLAGAALAVLAPAGMVAAQTQPPVQQAGSDALSPDVVYVEADAAVRQGDTITATASGGERALVRARGYTLRGENLSYDLAQGAATAEGRVETVAPDGTVVYATRAEFGDDFTTGVAVDFATRTANGASLMASTAVRRDAGRNELNYALFTPCPICDANGPKTPSIAIQAEKVVQDAELRAILYRNAVFRIGGVPVFYTPFFAHPDPTVDRASGFLIPVLDYDEGRGFSIETPYLHVVSPSEDWLISPQFNTHVAPFLNLQWRRRFANGMVVVRGGYTYERNFGDFDLDGDGDYESNVSFDDRESRSYLLSHGAFDLQGPWRAGFTLERTSDKTLFDRYDVNDPYQDNGLYYGDRRRLITQAYAERQTQRSYFSIAAFALQSLRLDPRFADTDFRDPSGFRVFEDEDTLPVVAPLIDFRWEPYSPILGGRLRLEASAVSLTRERFVGAPILNPEVLPAVSDGLPGVDTRRITGEAEWRRVILTAGGLRWEPFVDVRGDAYAVSDLPAMMNVSDDETVTRGRASAGLDLAYPLIRRTAAADIILEPMAQLSASTTTELDPRIPNEDSQTLELDETSLFRLDRFPGYDLLEGGVRFTLGGRATIRWAEDRRASLFVGRSYRSNAENDFLAAVPDAPDQSYDPTGLAAKRSDWVVQGDFSPSDRIRGWGHATISDNGDIRRAQAAVDGRWGLRNIASLSYIVDRSNPVLGPLNRNYEFVQLAAQQLVYGNWGVAGAAIADLNRDEITRSEVGLLFDDDCFRFEIGVRRDNTRVRPSGPSEGLYVRLNLATFGGSDYRRGEIR